MPPRVSPALPLRQAPEPAPLTSRRKFDLFGAFTIDPITYVAAGAVAGVEQAGNVYEDFGQGARGYGRRYGTAYADLFIAEFLGEALLPSLLKQDPRYFYKGSGTVGERTAYALSNSVLCRGDNGKRQVNYSRLFGDLAGGGISNLYYPSASRNHGLLTLYNFGFGISAQAFTNLMQEFLFHKTTGAN